MIRTQMLKGCEPFTYAYRYPSFPPAGATVIRFGTGGCEINASKPIEAIPLYTAAQIEALASSIPEPEAVTLRRARDALQAMMDAWLDYHDSHSLTQPVTGASANAFEKALQARDEIDAALTNVSSRAR